MNEPQKHKPGTRRFTFETVRAGQPRPHADSVYEYIVTVEWVDRTVNEFTPNPQFNAAIVLKVAKAFGEFKTKDENPGWSERILVSQKDLGDGRWQFIANQEYTG